MHHTYPLRNTANRRNRAVIPQQPIVQPQNNIMAAQVFVTNPYHGKINPGTSDGQKLYLKATAERTPRLTIKQENVKEIIATFEKDSRSFGWGSLVNVIKTSATDAIGKSIISNTRDLKLEMVQKAALKIWGAMNATFATPVPDSLDVQDLDQIATDADQQNTFYHRVRSEMISKRIENSISESSRKNLMLKKAAFTWKNTTSGTIHHDGPTMLYMLLSLVNPTTRVGVSELKKLIMRATLPKFDHNVINMLDDMASNYNRILELGSTHEDYLMQLFEALLTTHNTIYENFIQAEKNKWELGDDYTSDNLIEVATTKYNNMFSDNKWKISDSKDAKIIALTTKVEQLEKAFSTTKQPSGPAKPTQSSSRIEDWRKVKTTYSVEKNDLTWWWCPKHKFEGVFDGLYVRHKPEDHDAWQQRKDERKTQSKSQQSEQPATQKLTMSDKLKTALLTKCKLSASELDALVEGSK